jgi:MFS family permease
MYNQHMVLTMLFRCALQPLSGKLYQYFSLKWTYIFFLAVFEFGSLICATAVSSVMLIVGRAIAGMGAAGLFSGALVIVSHMIPLRQRPGKLQTLSNTQACYADSGESLHRHCRVHVRDLKYFRACAWWSLYTACVMEMV